MDTRDDGPVQDVHEVIQQRQERLREHHGLLERLREQREHLRQELRTSRTLMDAEGATGASRCGAANRDLPPHSRPATGPSVEGLTQRGRQTLSLLLEGKSEKQVAAAMGLSRNTVHKYVMALYQHFGVNSRAELLAHLLLPAALGRGTLAIQPAGEAARHALLLNAEAPQPAGHV